MPPEPAQVGARRTRTGLLFSEGAFPRLPDLGIAGQAFRVGQGARVFDELDGLLQSGEQIDSRVAQALGGLMRDDLLAQIEQGLPFDLVAVQGRVTAVVRQSCRSGRGGRRRYHSPT